MIIRLLMNTAQTIASKSKYDKRKVFSYMMNTWVVITLIEGAIEFLIWGKVFPHIVDYAVIMPLLGLLTLEAWWECHIHTKNRKQHARIMSRQQTL